MAAAGRISATLIAASSPLTADCVTVAMESRSGGGVAAPFRCQAAPERRAN
jgi:hypothetical protein